MRSVLTIGVWLRFSFDLQALNHHTHWCWIEQSVNSAKRKSISSCWVSWEMGGVFRWFWNYFRRMAIAVKRTGSIWSNQFLTLVGKGKIFNLLADREFIGKDWIEDLFEHEIPFDIRIRENMKVKYKNRITIVKHLFSRMPIGKTQTIRRMVTMGSNRVYLQGERIINSKTNRSEYLIICTCCQPAGSIRRYAERWYIENMFKDLKSNGFLLKCTHITAPDRLNTLMGILAIAYTWMIRIWKWVKKRTPKLFMLKKH